MNEAISGRMDMLNSINTAPQNVSARPAESKPYRISGPHSRNWEIEFSVEEFRSMEPGPAQNDFQRTTVQETRGQKGFEAWHARVRRYDQRNMSDKKIQRMQH